MACVIALYIVVTALFRIIISLVFSLLTIMLFGNLVLVLCMKEFTALTPSRPPILTSTRNVLGVPGCLVMVLSVPSGVARVLGVTDDESFKLLTKT